MMTEIAPLALSEKIPSEKVPDVLVYEEMDGKSIYYRGYRDVLAKQKKPEDIMGCSDVQGIIVSTVLRFLFRELPEDQYEIITNEVGLHLERGNNLSSDIVIYQRLTCCAHRSRISISPFLLW